MNKVFLIGHIVRKPEESLVGKEQIELCKFTLAVNRKFNREETDFLPIICWRNTAVNVAKFCDKGSKVAVSGSIQTRDYEAQDGTKRYITEIVADEVQFLDSRKSEDAEEPQKEYKQQSLAELYMKPLPLEEEDLPF